VRHAVGQRGRRYAFGRGALAALAALACAGPATAGEAAAAAKRLLYVTSPDGAGGSRNKPPGLYLFDIDDGHKFVRAIPIPTMGGTRGCCGSAQAKRLYISHKNTNLLAFDLVTEKVRWEVTYPKDEGGADRCTATLDGKKVYVPEGYWSSGYKKFKVVDGDTGKTIKVIDLGVGTAHNTFLGPSGKRMYVGPINTGEIFVIDTATDEIVSRYGPFGGKEDKGKIRGGRVSPYCMNGAETLCFVNSHHVGFYVGDMVNKKILHWVQVEEAKGFSHGVGMTPDEKEIWLTNPNDKRLWVFDATVMPPKRLQSIDVRSSSHGWITFSLDGAFAWPDTGDVIDARAKKVITTLKDDGGKIVASSKFIEIHLDKDGKVVRMGDQFGLGRVGVGTGPVNERK
jgi:DNA-binding beta-propeller fold protein YncE